MAGAVIRWCQDDFGAIRRQDSLPLGTGIGWQAQRDRVAHGRADHRVGDAGVPARRVDDRFPRLQQSACKSRFNHVQRRTVLHRSAGIKPLGLRVQLDIGEFTADSGEMQ